MKKQIQNDSSDQELSVGLSSAPITPHPEEAYYDISPTHESIAQLGHSPPPKNVDAQFKFCNYQESTDKIKDGGPRKRKLIIQRKTFLDK